MTRLICSLLLLALTCSIGSSQELYQRFDGNDTTSQRSLIIQKDSTSFWEVGSPDKTIFDTPSSPPNVMVTDTVKPYPTNDTGSFRFGINLSDHSFIPFKLIWMQQLDIGDDRDLGVVEFSIDTGKTWQNPYNSMNVENYYGYNDENLDTLPDSTIGFSGTDSSWQDVWVCFRGEWILEKDSLIVRFSLYSDSQNVDKEGWMIDDMAFRRTYIHTVGSQEENERIDVFPSPNDGTFQVKLKESQNREAFDEIKVLDTRGRVVKSIVPNSSRTQLSIPDQPPGIYYVKVTTGNEHQVVPVLIE